MKSFKKYFTVWWVPIVFYIIPFWGIQLGMSKKSNDIIDYSLMIFFVNIAGNIISAIVQIINRKWYFIFPQIIISAFLFFMVSLFFSYARPDYYGGDKEIPKNSGCQNPLEKAVQENEINSNDFKLKGGYGYYTYYTKFQPTEKGYLYIKAYEITSNDRLSEEYLDESSKIIIENLNQNFYSASFTIYNGNMGCQYCARIELWYKPNNKKEYKIKQKNYIIEGNSG